MEARLWDWVQQLTLITRLLCRRALSAGKSAQGVLSSCWPPMLSGPSSGHPLSKTYQSKQEFLDQVIEPFNARMAKPLVPTIRGLYADGDMVIIFFDAAATAKDGIPYHNTYTWYLQMKDGQVIKATAFFDTREFDEFWSRVSPTP